LPLQINDPGFGLKTDKLSGRILRRDGTINVERKGERFHFSDVYHNVVSMPWIPFLFLSVALYVVVNIAFGVVYLLIGTDQILNSHTDSIASELSDAMFFSAQTLTTVGYGNLSPASPLVSTVAAFEALAGLFLFGIFTGLSFVRFSRIKPRLTFSSTAVVAPFRNELNAFMFRIVNERSSVVMDASASLLLVMQDPENPLADRKYYQLPLQIASIKTLAMNWTIVHPIDSQSPLFGLDQNELTVRNAEFLIIINAFDDSVGQEFYTRNSYRPHEIVYGARFQRMYWTSEEGDVQLHLDKVHDTEPAELYP